jgi:hypothetical protein
MGTSYEISRLDAVIPRRQTPPAMLVVLPARLRTRAASPIHGLSTSDPDLS